MRRLPSIFRSAACAIALASVCGAPKVARAQACCAGGSVVTPARLEPHEKALVGAQLRTAGVIGSYTPEGTYLPSGAGTTELDLEQDVFGAVRFLRRAQAWLLLPFVETYRRQSGTSGLGGGIGDVNAGLRYDFLAAGEVHYVPGVALLAGVTAPTGRPPESATPPLNVDATGIGAWQFNGALAIEHIAGPWLLNATGIVAKRTPRFGETLGTQGTLLFAVAYVFHNEDAIALAVSYAFEGAATQNVSVPGSSRTVTVDVPGSSKRLTMVTLSGLLPLNDAWRLLGSVFVDPPLSVIASNQPATVGVAFTVVRSWF
jgi:hypothetical protein